MFKCIQPKLPKDQNAIFMEKEDNSLYFNGENEGQYGWFQDEEISNIATGHISASYGDSGSPYWTEVKVDDKSKPTLLAVQSLQTTFVDSIAPAYYSDLAYHQCRFLATKISEGVIQWLKSYMKPGNQRNKKPPHTWPKN